MTRRRSRTSSRHSGRTLRSEFSVALRVAQASSLRPPPLRARAGSLRYTSEPLPHLIRGDRRAAADAAPPPPARVLGDHLPRGLHVREGGREEARVVEILEEDVRDPLLSRGVVGVAVASVLRDEQLLRGLGDLLEEEVGERERVPGVL